MSDAIGTTIDTAANVTRFVGDAAKMAMTIGEAALPIIEFVAPWIPGIGPVLADLQIALPIIQKIATYAPQVQAGIQNGKPMIEAIIGVGEAIFGPLNDLIAAFPQLPQVHALFVDIDAAMKANEFTPQDPRFDRQNANA